uniref:C2H2-type domain-containing protein n=1 Tax=Oryza punctata TaxID=4537 RepID=A0A0E0MFN0_ORYPU
MINPTKSISLSLSLKIIITIIKIHQSFPLSNSKFRITRARSSPLPSRSEPGFSAAAARDPITAAGEGRMQQKPAAGAMEEEEVKGEAVGRRRPGLGFWLAARRRLPPDDPFFAAGDMERELLAKQVALDLSEDERYQLERMEVASANALFCPISGCGAHLDCLENFEDHYSTRHTASCSVCWRVYPTSRLLSIHISEAHDSFFQAKVARGFPMYECLVEGCGVKLKSYKSRQQHLLDKHQFPKSFEFFKKARPSQRQRNKNQKQRQTVHKGEETSETLMDVDVKKSSRHTNSRYRPKQHDGKESKENEHSSCKEAKNNEMEVDKQVDELASAVSRLSTADSTPSSISFGHRRSRGLAFVPRSIRQNKQVSQTEPK